MSFIIPTSLHEDKETKSGNAREVYIRVVFIRVGNIDTAAEQFFADALVEARWREPQLDGNGNEGETKDVPALDTWDPEIYIENNIDEPNERTRIEVKYEDGGKCYIVQKRRVTGMLSERLELYNYPFDSQDLSLVVTTHRSQKEVALIKDPFGLSTVNTATFIGEQQWELHKSIIFTSEVFSEDSESSPYQRPGLIVSCKASRRYGYFLWNVFSIIFIIGFLMFTVFGITAENCQDRLNLSFTLLLSFIIFKYDFKQTIPKVSYSTILDGYVGLQAYFMWLNCVYHAVIYVSAGPMQLEEEALTKMNKYMIGVFAFSYTIINAWTAFQAWSRVSRRKTFLEVEPRTLDLTDGDILGGETEC